jgi:hypothetical protein
LDKEEGQVEVHFHPHTFDRLKSKEMTKCEVTYGKMEGKSDGEMGAKFDSLIVADTTTKIKIKKMYQLPVVSDGVMMELCQILDKSGKQDKHVAIFETTEFEWHGKRRKIFDIPGSTRTVILDGEKHIRVRLEADTKDELYLRISRLKGEMAKLGIKEVVCVWDNIGHLTIEKERPKPKQKVEFDQSYLTKQKTLELETYRQD